MKKIILLSLSFLFSVLTAHVKEKSLFAQSFIFHETSRVATAGNISFITGVEQFTTIVLQNKKPVVVQVFKGRNNRLVESIFKDVAGAMQQKVSFVAIDVLHPENNAVIMQIVGQLGVRPASYPFFLLFKQRTLLLPPLVFPPIFGFVAKEKIDQIKIRFMQYIETQFFRVM